MTISRSVGLFVCVLSLVCFSVCAEADDKGKGKKGNGNSGKQGGGNHGHSGGNHQAGHNQGGHYQGGNNYYQGGNNYQGGHNHGGSGQTYLDISPNGIGIGYQDRNFGIQVGPIGGYNYGYGRNYGYSNSGIYNDYYYQQPRTYYQPIVEQAIIQPSVIQPSIIQPSMVVEQPLYPVAPPLISGISDTDVIASPRPSQVLKMPIPERADATTLIPVNEQAARFQIKAEEAFRSHKYEDAAKTVEHSLIEDSKNGKLHLFASQCRFAIGDYRGAAIGIDVAQSLLEENEQGYVVSNYKQFYNNDDYVTQMNRLVEFNRDNSEIGYAYMLRGYHYLHLGHKEAAREQLAKALELDPQDNLAKELLKQAGESPVLSAPAPVPTPATK